MERKLLQERLERCAPALSSTTVIPVLTHFAFTGTQVMAYNDSIAVVTPCKTEFKGAVPGTTLLNLIRLSRAKDVEFVQEGNDLIIKAASSRFKLPVMPLKEFTDIFTPPEVKESGVLAVAVPEFTRCIGQLMRSVSDDTSVPDQLGITLIPGKKQLCLYSTNWITMSKATLKLSRESSIDRAILSKQFCEQLLVLAKGEQTLKLEVEDDHATLVAGATLLHGKLIISEQPMKFEDIIAQNFPVVKADELAPIPSKFRNIVERALVVGESKNDSAKTRIVVKEDRMRFVTKSERGEVVDSMQVTDKQPATALALEAKHLKKGLDDFDQMLMTEQGCIMAKENVTYMISPQE
jgi:DNA polymerase III sliding clamp (beta) subunit (PCNA family)